jgi:hypothetical protein
MGRDERLCTAPQAPDDGPQRRKALPSPTKRALRRDGRSVAQWPVRERRIHTMAYTHTRGHERRG